MGTRADFYIQPGDDLSQAVWQGSLGWDGHPGGRSAVWQTKSLKQFTAALAKDQAEDDWTDPEQGWPWPWNDSNTTDYAYVFVEPENVVKVYAFGTLIDPQNEKPAEGRDKAPFPDMTARKNVAFGVRSGLTIIGPDGPVNIQD